MHTVTIVKKGQRFTVTFSQLPGRTFGPWEFAQTVRDLQVSALLSPISARDLVMDAATQGSATSEMG